MAFSLQRFRLQTVWEHALRPSILNVACRMFRGASCAQIDIFADGVAIKEPGAECFRLLRQFLDGVLLVTSTFSLIVSECHCVMVVCGQHLGASLSVWSSSRSKHPLHCIL